jgi:hypothetical protein
MGHLPRPVARHLQRVPDWQCRADGGGDFHRIPHPLGETHLNVKRLMAGWTRGPGMMGAMKRLGLETTLAAAHHRGADEAVLAHVIGHELAVVVQLELE